MIHVWHSVFSCHRSWSISVFSWSLLGNQDIEYFNSVVFFNICFYFQPLGKMFQFDESFYKWLAQPPPIGSVFWPLWPATFEVSNLKDHLCTQIHRVPIGHQKGQELRRVQWRCFPGMLGPFVSCFRKKTPGRMKNQRRNLVYLIYCKLELVM